MVNPGVVGLISVSIILTVIVVVILIFAGISFSKDSMGNNNGTTGLPSCTQNVNISNLLQISGSETDCLYNGATGTVFYIGTLGNQEYDYVVTPWAFSPQDVCVSFCTGYNGGICSGSNYGGKSAQDNYNYCISQLTSTTCIPPIPLAAKGTTLYYAWLPTYKQCNGLSSK